MRTPGFWERCYLLDHGVPFDVAHAMSPAYLMAYFWTLAQINGMKFNEKTMEIEPA